MDVKREIKWCTQVLKWQRDAVRSGNAREADSCGQLVGQSLDNIGRWADMAEAAVALAEYQATSGYDPEVDSKTYTAERGRLWHAFIMARAKAKGASNEPT